MPTMLTPMSRAVRASMQLIANKLWFLLDWNRRCVDPKMALVKLVWCCVVMAVFLKGLVVCAVLL